MSARKSSKKNGPQSAPFFQPPAVGGETHIRGRDEDAIRAALYAREKHPIAMLVRIRQEAADNIERLIAFLDATEGDCELWDDAEPTIGDIRHAAAHSDAPQEDDEDGADAEPDAESEPSLGWPERIGGRVDHGATTDCEVSPSIKVTNNDRRKFFRSRHGNVRPIPGARWVVA